MTAKPIRGTRITGVRIGDIVATATARGVSNGCTGHYGRRSRGDRGTSLLCRVRRADRTRAGASWLADLSLLPPRQARREGVLNAVAYERGLTSLTSRAGRVLVASERGFHTPCRVAFVLGESSHCRRSVAPSARALWKEVGADVARRHEADIRRQAEGQEEEEKRRQDVSESVRSGGVLRHGPWELASS